jgi:hypothetical protein
MKKRQIMYVERKAGSLEGPARIGWVTFSKTGKTIHYNGQSFQSLKGRGFKSNYFDVETGDEYWISGVRKDRQDRLYGGGLHNVEIDDDAKEEYARLIQR